ncbi:hypothetical protein [Eubacterium aggregans]|uniref:hypothetical protein n=1 Tax=Eubacterium aggregans TaxID=81409 RepID=UPI003F40CF84
MKKQLNYMEKIEKSTAETLRLKEEMQRYIDLGIIIEKAFFLSKNSAEDWYKITSKIRDFFQKKPHQNRIEKR